MIERNNKLSSFRDGIPSPTSEERVKEKQAN